MAFPYRASFVPPGPDEDQRMRLALSWLADQAAQPPRERLVVAPSGPALRHAQALTPNPDLGRFATWRTAHQGSYWHGGPLLLAFPPKRIFSEWIVDRRAEAFCIVPGPGLNIDAWVRASQAVDLTIPTAPPPGPTIEDPVTAEAMRALSAMGTPTTHQTHDEDKALIVLTLQQLQAAGSAFEPVELEAWALADGWEPGAAAGLAEYARGVRQQHRYQLREKDLHICQWTVGYWREKARRREERGGTLPEEVSKL